jgi:hypothetical protein
MNAFRKYGGRNTLLVLAAIFTILMMGTLPAARAFSGSATTAEFWRTGCGDLSSNIQARFEWDVTNFNAMTIKEVGQQGNSYNNVDGGFELDEFTQGYYYAANVAQYQYPGVEALADFRHYQIFGVNLTVTAPVNGLSNPTVQYATLNMSASYLSANFSTAADEFQIIISQSSTAITAEYDIISSTGTTLQSWSQPKDLSTVSNVPPYTNYGVSDELHGLEKLGFAHVLTGTDFQIESVIHPYTATDFTGHQFVSYTQNSMFSEGSPLCFTTFAEDEGTDATYTYGASGPVQSSNEYYQYVEVT